MGERYHFQGRRWWWWLAAALLLVPVLGMAWRGVPAPVPAAQALDGCVARAMPDERPETVIDRATGFDCQAQQPSFGPGDFWVRMTGLAARTTADQPLVLRFTPEWQRQLTVTLGYADGTLITHVIPAGRQLEVTRMGQAVELPLPDRPAPLTRVLVRADGAENISRIVRDIRIIPVAVARVLDQTDTAMFATVLGIYFALLIYNLALWTTLREKFQFYYCASVVAMMGYALSYSDAITLFLPSADAIQLMQQRYVTLAMVAGFLLLFVRHFFEPGTIGPRLVAAINGAVALLVLVAVPFAMNLPVSPHLADRIYLLAFLPVPILVAAMTWAAWRARSPLVGLFMTVWSVPFAIVAIRILHAAHLLEYPVWFDSCTVLAMAVESLMSSLALAYRIKLIRRERDVARAEEAFARRLANSDPLTGLLNRRALVGAALAEPGAYHLVLVDIDHFKRVNDSHGHDVGDAVLVRLAALLGEWAAAHGARAARLGGEEFAVLAPAARNIASQAERLLALVREHRMPGPRRVTISAGVAEREVAGDGDWQVLYHEADAALYRAKHAGRDCVERAGDQRISRNAA
ncbi:MAG: diguanylate cyclase [Proteobacteria bacterium]|nr:diguanylate cyclase [Pseudomonadota bacterium]